MTDADLVDRLAGHRTLAGVPREQLQWVASHGRLHHFAPGDVVTPKSGPVLGLYVVLSGHLSIHVDRGAGPRKVMEWRGGDVTGVLPYSRVVSPPGSVIAEEPSELLVVDRRDLREMTRVCHELTDILVHVMVDRARHFTSSDRHDEKMLSLGKLAAGLAHELNNPASAVARSAAGLVARLAEVDQTSRALGSVGLSATELEQVEVVRNQCLATVTNVVRSPIEQADREDSIAAWLEDHGADVMAAEALAESAVTFEGLNQLAEVLQGEKLDAALRSIATGCVTRKLASEIEAAASRIYRLVAAVKGFTYMDQATVATPVDVGQGLADTLAVLQSKARAKSVGVTIDVKPDLPRIQGFGGELNQVWANLIDNALDAAPKSGRVEVTATGYGSSIVVRVVDDGPGIPADVQERMFDPFFTTKPVGEGTGLGLDIVRRLVSRHYGEIEVDSRPGRTEFRVSLPFPLSALSQNRLAEN